MSLKGSLQTVALPEVLDFLSGTGKTGELRVDGADAEGVVWFEEGSIAGVRVERGPSPVEAVFQLLRIEEGDFSFNSGEVRPEDVGAVDREQGQVPQVLAEAQDRLRQWSDIVSVVPSLRHRISLSSHSPSEIVSLDQSQWELIVAIGEGRSVGDILSTCNLGEFEGCSSLKGLIEARLAEVGEPAPQRDEQPVAVAAEEPASDHLEPEPLAAPEGSPFLSAVDGSDPSDSGYSASVDDHSAPASFEVFKGFDSTGFGYGEEDGSNDSFFSADPQVGIATEPEAGTGRSLAAFGLGYEPEQAADVETESESEGSGDRYASLRSVMDEVGRSLEDDPFAEEEHVAEIAMPAFGSPAAFATDGSDGETAFPEADEAHGHAALHALLAEVSNEETATEPEEAVDGLADRGPWTSNELASFDGWHAEADSGATGEEAPVAHSLFGQPPAMDFAPGVEAAVEQFEPQDEEPAPVEEPINRGLLLKFLSSVRN